MKSIQSTTQRAFRQALACASYRRPDRDAPPARSLACAHRLRYGLFACAAAHALLQRSQNEEEIWILDYLGEIGDDIVDHFAHHAFSKLSPSVDSASAWRVGEMAQMVADDFAPLAQRVADLQRGSSWSRSPSVDIRLRKCSRPSPFGDAGKPGSDSRRCNRILSFAERLYERRLMDLEEVPEIALLGE